MLFLLFILLEVSQKAAKKNVASRLNSDQAIRMQNFLFFQFFYCCCRSCFIHSLCLNAFSRIRNYLKITWIFFLLFYEIYFLGNNEVLGFIVVIPSIKSMLLRKDDEQIRNFHWERKLFRFQLEPKKPQKRNCPLSHTINREASSAIILFNFQEMSYDHFTMTILEKNLHRLSSFNFWKCL